MIDLSSEHAGTLCGVSNSISALPGVIGNSATGYILGATGSWTIVFGIVEVMYVIGLFAFIGLARDKLKR